MTKKCVREGTMIAEFSRSVYRANTPYSWQNVAFSKIPERTKSVHANYWNAFAELFYVRAKRRDVKRMSYADLSRDASLIAKIDPAPEWYCDYDVNTSCVLATCPLACGTRCLREDVKESLRRYPGMRQYALEQSYRSYIDGVYKTLKLAASQSTVGGSGKEPFPAPYIERSYADNEEYDQYRAEHYADTVPRYRFSYGG